MANKITNTAYYAAIADALRAKYGDQLMTFTPAQMAAAITDLPTGGDLDGYIDGSLTTIETGATSIKNYAFYDDRTLLEVIAPKAAIVGYSAFYGCDYLQTVSLPSASIIRQGAFEALLTLTSVTLPSAVDLSDNSIFASSQKLALSAIPVSSTIGEKCFYNCKKLSATSLPEGIATIKQEAFKGCTALRLASFPTTLTEIGIAAFDGCTGITVSVFPATITRILTSAFKGCTGLRTLKIKSDSVYLNAFSGCTGITKVWLGSGVTTIMGSYASSAPFYGCTNLTDIYTEATEKPSGWDTYFAYTGSSTQATVHYGVSEADFDAIIAA